MAGFANIAGVLIFSKLFSNEAINQADPVVMSNFGLLMIIVWGVAYWGAALVDGNVRWLAAAFCIEKLVYVIIWGQWHLANDISALYNTDVFAGIFYAIYGLNDLIYLFFFAYVFWRQSSQKTS